MLYVSPQINFEVPAGTAPGDATPGLVNAPATLLPVMALIRNLAPGLFTLENTMAAAYAVRIEPNEAQTPGPPPGTAITLDDRPVYLILYATGIRNRCSLNNVQVTIGGADVPVTLNLHVKDIAVKRAGHNKGFVIEGRPAGRGQLDIPRLFSRLAEMGRDPTVILEQWPPPEDSIAASIEKEHEWAREGVEYLRPLIAAY